MNDQSQRREEPGLVPIGSLTTSIANSPDRTALILTRPLPNSAITGSGSPAPVAASSIGIPRSETDAVTLLAKGADEGNSALVHDALTALRKSAPTLLKPWLERISEPAKAARIAPEIIRCLQLTASRERDGMDLRMMVASLSEELAEYPWDVVKTALREWSRSEKWWPTLAEMREACQWRVDRRRRWLTELQS